jgi:hypothetical protein
VALLRIDVSEEQITSIIRVIKSGKPRGVTSQKTAFFNEKINLLDR